MISKARALGLALIAVFSMSALAGSAAQAAAPEFHSDTNPTVITGTATEQAKFVTSGGTVKCTEEYKATSTGTQSGTTWTTSSVTVTPVYSNCTAFGFVGATIDVDTPGHECGYLFNLVAGSSPPTATVDVECKNAGEDITVTASACTTHVEPQTGLAHVIFENQETKNTDKRDILATATITGIKYTETSGCFGGHNNETQSNGTLNGKVTLKGFVDSGVGTYGEGAQKGIWVE